MAWRVTIAACAARDIRSDTRVRRARSALPGLLAACTLPVAAFDTLEWGDLTVHPTFNTRLGLQRGDNVNFGLGALDSLGETERTVLYLAAKPGFTLDYAATETRHAYAGFSYVAATTTLDGELSGQVARAGDQAFDTDHAYVGWKNELVDLSFGAQEFTVGDGFIIGDGNFNQGGEDGQYWTGAFLAWRNSAVLRVNTRPVRAEAFWLRTDNDFRDGRVVGGNLETVDLPVGTFGAMYVEVLQGGAFNLDGINAWNLRGAGVKVPGVPGAELFGEWVLQKGRDEQAGGRPNDAVGWYLEAQYSFATLPWTPRVNYRYARFSGDELDTPENEEYRGMYFTIFKRDWDTWYQGEIAGEYHLFNQNQVTQMFKVKVFPRPRWALTFYYYHHELEEPQYFGTPVSDERWADELNLGVEYVLDRRFYGYAGIAWSTPHTAAEEIFGNDNFAVIETFLSYTF